MTDNDNPTVLNPKPTAKRHRGPTLPRVSFNVREYARMTGRTPNAVRREIERRARRADDGACVAELALGVRAYKAASAGRWSIVVPRSLVTE